MSASSPPAPRPSRPDTTAGTQLPVAKAWFVRKTVDEAISLITEPYVHPFLQANIWHIRGRDRNLLIDCGLGVASLRSAFPDLFDRETVLVVTHAHLDHMGCAHEFEHCWAHPDEPVARPLPGTLSARALYKELGMDPGEVSEDPDLLISARPTEDFDPGAYVLRPVRPTRALREGDAVDLGDRRLTVLHLPGHTPGSIALLDAGRGMLFSGDVVYDDELLDGIDGADVEAYLGSMRRLRGLAVSVVHPGHGRSFGRERLWELADEYITDRTSRKAS